MWQELDPKKLPAIQGGHCLILKDQAETEVYAFDCAAEEWADCEGRLLAEYEFTEDSVCNYAIIPFPHQG